MVSATRDIAKGFTTEDTEGEESTEARGDGVSDLEFNTLLLSIRLASPARPSGLAPKEPDKVARHPTEIGKERWLLR
jgi:hypothetical protein